MTTLICTGSLFSGWQKIFGQQVATDSSKLPVYAEISGFVEGLCQQQVSQSDKLCWQPFTVDNATVEKASTLFSTTDRQSLFAWDDSNNCLCLDLWKAAVKDAVFLLYYSSPEFELTQYILSHSYDVTKLESVIEAWIVRTRAMLTFFMNHRERSVLISVESAKDNEKAVVQLLNEIFGLGLTPPTTTALGSGCPVFVEYLATSRLLDDHRASELYDEVRSAATLIDKQDESIPSIQDRNSSLINTYLSEVESYEKLKEELYLNNIQINQMQDDLEFYFNKISERQTVADSVAEYLTNEPLLKLARQVRQQNEQI